MLTERKRDRPLRFLAREIGCSVAYLSYVLNRQREPGPRILNYLGLERIQPPPTYRKRRK